MTKYTAYADLTDDQRVMVDSESADDRARAAVFGWGIDKLADDESDMVADTAWRYMEKNGVKPYEWRRAI